MEAQGTSPPRTDYIPTEDGTIKGSLLARSSGQREMVGPPPGRGSPQKEGELFLLLIKGKHLLGRWV